MILVFVLLVGGLGWLFGQFMGTPSVTPYVLIGAGVYALFSYVAGSSAALAFSGAREITKHDYPRLWRIVENIAITEGLPMPRVYLIDDPAPNAMATGRNPKHASVAATTGIMDILTNTELEGVMAHELGHVKNYDIRVSMVAFALVGVVGVISDVILRMVWFRDNDNNNNSPIIFVLGITAAVLAPLIAILIQLSISRRREYLADATGALATRYPEGLAIALEKIEAHGSALKRQNTSTAHFFFANPLKSKGLLGMFSTHPPVEDRVKRLRSMGTHE